MRCTRSWSAPGPPGETETRRTGAYDLIWPHLGPSRAAECETRDPSAAHRLGALPVEARRVRRCLASPSRLENLWSHHLGADHPQTLHLRFQIANVLRSQGRFDEARDLDTYVLGRQREVLGEDHLHTLMTAGSLAADLRALGEFQEALDSDQETYDRFKEQFGEDYPRTLRAANNLAVSLRLVGDCSAARRLDQETHDRQHAWARTIPTR